MLANIFAVRGTFCDSEHFSCMFCGALIIERHAALNKICFYPLYFYIYFILPLSPVFLSLLLSLSLSLSLSPLLSPLSFSSSELDGIPGFYRVSRDEVSHPTLADIVNIVICLIFISKNFDF